MHTPVQLLKKIVLSFKHVSVAPTPRPRTRKPKRISMNAGGFTEVFQFSVHVCISMLSFLCIDLVYV